MLQSSGGGTTRTPQDLQRLLAATADLAVDSLSRLFAGALGRLAVKDGKYPVDLATSALTTSADLNASQWLGRQRDAFAAELKHELVTQGANDGASIPARRSGPPRSFGSLEVMSYDETEILVTIKSLAQWVENLSQEEFYLFNHRYGFLAGEFALPPARNPFSPLRVFEAFDAAGKRLDGYPLVRLTLLRLLKRAGLESIAAVYGTLNQFLLDQGVLPRFRPRIRHDPQQEDARLRAAGPVTEESEAFKRLLARLADEARRRIDPAAVKPAPPVQPPAPAVDTPVSARVVAIPATDWRSIATQRTERVAPRASARTTGTMLDAIRSSAIARRIGRPGAAALQITNYAFDRVLVAPELTKPIRLLLSRLQVAFYKVAVLDTTVLSRRPHPARALVNRISEAGIAWSPELGEDDSLYLTISEIVERLQQGVGDDVSVFSDQLSRFEGFIATETQSAKQAAIVRARDLFSSERHRVGFATAAVELERALKDEVYPPLPEFAERFVRNRWVHALRDAYVREGRDGQAWQSNVDFLHELTWSLKPKPTDSERRILLKMLPQLVGRIEATMEQAGTRQGVKDFLTELMQAHIFLIRKGVLPRHLRGGGSLASSPNRVNYEQIIGKLDPELLKRSAPGALRVGSWVEFGNGSAYRYRKKLVWVSPLSNRALFTNRRGEGEIVLTPTELTTRISSGNVVELKFVPLFEASLSDAKLRLADSVSPVAAAPQRLVWPRVGDVPLS